MATIWILFILFIVFLLALDLGVFHKKAHAVSIKESLVWTFVWITISLLFGIVMFYLYKYNLFGINNHLSNPKIALLDYYTGYIIEKSLSLDNIFVIAIIFSYFKIEHKFQHRILFWGIIGAIIFRGIMIFLGTAFINKFSWSAYIFGAILIFSAIKMLTDKNEDVDYSGTPALKILSRIIPINWESNNSSFFTKINGKNYATISFAALIVIEFTDVIFAVDSIPAILSITTDRFIVFTSNIFAILGLRSLYFLIANMLEKFKYMKFSLVLILIFVGIKMGLSHHYEIPTLISLCFILGALATGILTSIYSNGKMKVD